MIRVSSAEQDKVDLIQGRLLSYRGLVADYRACKALYDELYPSGTIRLSDMPKAESHTYEPERWATKRMDIRERMAASLDEMREEYEKIAEMIDILPHDQHCIIVRKYMLLQTFEQIARAISYEERTVRRIHNKAIRKLVRQCPSDS